MPDFTVDLFGLELTLSETHPESESEDDESMAGVAEHDGKQEREGDDGEDGRVGLAVTGNPIRVNQFLKVSIFF